MKDYNRYDMSEWVIHFVHDRQSKDDLYALREICKLEEPDVEYRIPTYFDKRKRPHDLTDEHSDDEWWIGEDAPAFDESLEREQTFMKVIDEIEKRYNLPPNELFFKLSSL